MLFFSYKKPSVEDQIEPAINHLTMALYYSQTLEDDSRALRGHLHETGMKLGKDLPDKKSKVKYALNDCQHRIIQALGYLSSARFAAKKDGRAVRTADLRKRLVGKALLAVRDAYMMSSSLWSEV